jgi:hypothetical protein
MSVGKVDVLMPGSFPGFLSLVMLNQWHAPVDESCEFPWDLYREQQFYCYLVVRPVRWSFSNKLALLPRCVA